MTSFEFVNLILENLGLAFFIFLFSNIIYYSILKKTIYGLLDPLLYFYFFSCVGFSTIIFLYVLGKINLGQFLQYLITQLSFFIGLLVIKPGINLKFANKINPGTENFFFNICFLFFIITKIYIYKGSGIPLLNESRLEVYFSDSFLVTISNRVQSALKVFLVSMIAFKLNYSLNIKNLALLSFFIIFSILDGSKSAIIGIFFIISITTFYFNQNQNSRLFNILYKNKLKSLIIILISTLLIVSLATPDPLYLLIYRLVISGDSFYMTLPNEVLFSIVDKNNWNTFLELFKGPLSLIGIYKGDMQPLGFKVMEYHTGITGIMKGPIIRHNLFGLINFGIIGSIIYSFIIGLLVSYSRKLILGRNYKSQISTSLRISLFFCVLMLPSDFYNFLNGLIDILFILVPLIIFYKLLSIKNSIGIKI